MYNGQPLSHQNSIYTSSVKNTVLLHGILLVITKEPRKQCTDPSLKPFRSLIHEATRAGDVALVFDLLLNWRFDLYFPPTYSFGN